jgi:hypothetical protein
MRTCDRLVSEFLRRTALMLEEAFLPDTWVS